METIRIEVEDGVAKTFQEAPADFKTKFKQGLNL